MYFVSGSQQVLTGDKLLCPVEEWITEAFKHANNLLSLANSNRMKIYSKFLKTML